MITLVLIYFITTSIRLVQKNLPYNNFARGEQRNLGDGMQDNCILFHALASIVNITDSKFAISFELVGNRFLRNMVRTIVVSNFKILRSLGLKFIEYEPLGNFNSRIVTIIGSTK